MSLEFRVAYWIELGLMPYQDLINLQDKIVGLRKREEFDKDIILSVQHPPEVSFGSKDEYNKFSDEFLREVKRLKGSTYSESDIINVLSMKGLGFSRTKRGGGATVLAPGQLVFYPIVNPMAITRQEFSIGGYKRVLDNVMYDALRSFGVKNIEIASGFSKLDRERRDVWHTKNGKSYKIGSKGINFSKKLVHNGFVLYVGEDCVDRFWVVKPCGYDHEEVSVISAEEVLGEKLDYSRVRERVKQSIKERFFYDKIIELTPNILNSYFKEVEVPNG